MPHDIIPLRDRFDASVTRGGDHTETITLHGRYDMECRGPDGALKWAETIDNIVCTLGKNVALDAFLAGAAYTVTGPFMGLISSTSFTAVSASDTMASHSGWLEAGATNAPTYTSPRKTCAWAAASGGSKALSAALSFAITGTGTVQGAFLTYSTGAVSTIDSTTGTLLSAGVFTGGAKAVSSGDTVNVSYTMSA